MNDRPDALELIRIANQTLASEVLPDAKHEHQYALRMIANALGIAARELEARDKTAADETLGLNTLYSESKESGELSSRNLQFARDIRLGAFESSGAREVELRQHLVATARAKLAAAYPKGLASSKNK
ncbi:MAG: DUF6285 domain-containing protein [Burkholderiales bacterium]